MNNKQSTNSLEEFLNVLREHEIKTFSKFVCISSQKAFTEEKFMPNENTKIHWNGAVPHINIGCRVYACHQGKDKNLYQKKRYAEKRDSKACRDHDFTERRKLAQPTKKLDCPVVINVYRVLALPRFKVLCSSAFRSFSSKSTLTLVSQNAGVRKITLNNPSKRNALSLAMIEKLHKDVLQNAHDENLRCIVINHKGPVFSSGHDLKELSSSNRSYQMEIFQKCSELMVGLRNIPVPVIAVVNGVAAAAGCQLVASCDISIATENSQFSTPGAAVGLFCSTPGIAICRNIPLKASAYMLFTGSMVSAKDALLWGLISKMAKEDDLDKVTDEVLKEILKKSRSVLALGKKFFYEQLNKDIESAYSSGSEVMVDNLAKSEAEEGIKAFFEKRPPKW